MPFVKISTLKRVLNRERIMQNIEHGLYAIQYYGNQLIPDGMATCMWQSMDIVVHKNEVHTEHRRKDEEVPVFVDLYMNTVFNQDGVTLVMETIANELSKTGEIDIDNVVIMVHIGQPGYIFIKNHVDDCMTKGMSTDE